MRSFFEQAALARLRFLRIGVLVLCAVLFAETAFPCSMYKVTVAGKTMVGNNEDSWGRDARIWFEPGADGKFGMVCVGYARKQPNPDGAMNEYGLAFDAFTMPHKNDIPAKDPRKKDFSYSDLRTIMQHCKTVDEVYNFLKDLNLQALNGSVLFNGGMLLFADKSGKYLVVEAKKMTFGSEASFALANFSIADTKDLRTVTMERYCKGVAFLRNKPAATSLAFCTALSDTMSVRRKKVGDGTLYTSIYDLDEGLVHLYFFHDFSRRVTFNLKDELAKGARSYAFADLFPDNKNFEPFLAYKTPQNNRTIFIFLVFASVLFFVSAISFVVGFFRSTHGEFRFLKMFLACAGGAFCWYMLVLLKHETIFYFPSPYKEPHAPLVSIASYLPIILLVCCIPLGFFMLKVLRQSNWSRFGKCLFLLNNVVYLVLIGLFAYWGLFGQF